MNLKHDFTRPGTYVSQIWNRYKSADNVQGVDLDPTEDRISLKYTEQNRETLVQVSLTKGEGPYAKSFKELTTQGDLQTLSAYSYNGHGSSGYQVNQSPFQIKGVSLQGQSYQPLSLGESIALFQLATKEFSQ